MAIAIKVTAKSDASWLAPFGQHPRPLALGALVWAATLVAYLPALSAGFIWDDSGHITRPDLQSWSGLGRIWCEIGATQQYYPLLHTAFWIEQKLLGSQPAGYHLLNIIWHASAACLLALCLRRLLEGKIGSNAVSSGQPSTHPVQPSSSLPGIEWIAALLFALHPVGVESVAWISEQKNTLSTVLYLAAVYIYLGYARHQRASTYLMATACFVGAVLTKSVTVTLPAALLVMLWWQRRPLNRRTLLPLLPWFIFSAAFGMLTTTFERRLIGARGTDFLLGAGERLLLAGRVVCFYVGKLIWPTDLTFIYPRWDVDASAPDQYIFPGVVLATAVLLFWRRQRWPGILAVFLFFLGSLFPALGFFNVFPFIFSFVADHFQYLATLGFFVGASYALCRAASLLPPWVGTGAILSLLCGLGIQTWRQSEMYHDVFILYETTLARNPRCWMAENNLAEAEAGAGRAADAIPHLERALQLRPRFPEAENNLGDDLRLTGRPLEAIPHFQHALALQPHFAPAHNNLGIALMNANQPVAGLAEFRLALADNPAYAQAAFNIGSALASTNNINEALGYFARAAHLDPQYPEAELNWGIALAVTGNYSLAVPHFNRALELRPESAEIYNEVGRAALETKNYSDAVARLERAVELDPRLLVARESLVLALQRNGQSTEAAAQIQAIREILSGAR